MSDDQRYKRIGVSPLARLCRSMKQILALSIRSETHRLQRIAAIQRKQLAAQAPTPDGEKSPRELKAEKIRRMAAKMEADRREAAKAHG